MKAAIQTGLRQIEMFDIDEPGLSDSTAIVRTRVSGICGSDLHPYHGRAARQKAQDGHEVAGIIEHLPSTYTGPLTLGDRVAVDTVCLGISCGACAYCQSGQYFHCVEHREPPPWGGAFAQAFERRPAGLFKLPDSLTDEQGALVEPLAVAVHGARWARMKPGGSVAIIGAGSIGLITLIAARAMGAGPVHVVARHPHQAALAMELGAASAVVPEKAMDTIRAATRGGVDLVFETVGGHADTINLAWDLARIQGTVAIIGIFPDKVAVNLLRPVIRELWATFPICYGIIDGVHDFEVAIDLIASGKAPVERLVTHRYPLSDTPEAFRVAADKSTGSVKVHLIP
ncbi:MAG: Zn-dependent alcohol dehydrogenase [Chloroflexota bacterium]|nr:MAG: Zn-dependent alcohol dehydrogenase [Chloroflexota bacterium]